MSSDVGAAQSEKEQKLSRLRQETMKEIVTTEYAYIEDIKACITHFVTPLTTGKHSQVLPQDDVKTIFSNLPQILGINQALYKSVRENMGVITDQSSVKSMANAFLQMADYLKMYTGYIDNYDSALEKLQECRKKYPKFAKFESETAKKAQVLRIDDLIVRPVQRICKYPLLFDSLIKNTPETHEVRPLLKETLGKVKAIANHVNKSTGSKQNFQKMVDFADRLKSSLDGEDLFENNRSLIKEGAIEVGSSQGGPVEERTVLIFSDMILITKPKKKKQLAVVHKLLLSNCSDPKEAEQDVAFDLQCKDDTYCFITNSQLDKKSWMSAISGQIVTAKALAKEQRKRRRMSHDKVKAKRSAMVKSPSRNMRKKKRHSRTGSASSDSIEGLPTLKKLSSNTIHVSPKRRRGGEEPKTPKEAKEPKTPTAATNGKQEAAIHKSGVPLNIRSPPDLVPPPITVNGSPSSPTARPVPPAPPTDGFAPPPPIFAPPPRVADAPESQVPASPNSATVPPPILEDATTTDTSSASEKTKEKKLEHLVTEYKKTKAENSKLKEKLSALQELLKEKDNVLLSMNNLLNNLSASVTDMKKMIPDAVKSKQEKKDDDNDG